jgi:hypothetical protein
MPSRKHDNRPQIFAEKNERRVVDASEKCASLVTPLDSGTPLIGSSFYVHLGLQIGLNFVPGFEFREGGKQIVRARVGFFCALNVRECWFFDIYIQGSKKVQL